jgi:patatin-like phospholipase/acyl hydrolase
MFRILCLDGGGSRGAFEAGFLSETERVLGKPLSDYFDLIVGTSTGGYIAAGLAYGLPAQDVMRMYRDKLGHLWCPYDNALKGMERIFAKMTNPLLESLADIKAENLVHSRYSRSGLEALMSELMGDARFVDIKKSRLMLTAVNLSNGAPFIFKTPHLPNQGDNYNFSLAEALFATSAAPTYFDPIKIEGHGVFGDGGLWANNPAMVAYAEAVNIADKCNRASDVPFKESDIYMLSLGCGRTIMDYTPPEGHAGFSWWVTRLFSLLFESQGDSTCFYLERMMQDRFKRIDFDQSNPEWSKIDNPHYITEMLQMGKIKAQKEYPALKEIFFKEKKPDFVPFAHKSITR